MNPEILISILGGVASVLGLSATQALFMPLLRRLLKRPSPVSPAGFAERLAKLTNDLRTASVEVDHVLLELAQVATDREAAVGALETKLRQLEAREKGLQTRIDVLQKVPLPVAEYFAALTAAGEGRSAKRDYLLFGMGAAVSTALSVIFFLIQG